MTNVGFPQSGLAYDQVRAAARTLGLDIAPLEIRRAEDIAPAFNALKLQAGALYVVDDAFIDANKVSIITLALAARLPTIFSSRTFVQAGALMSYGPSFPALFRRPPSWSTRFCAGRSPGTSRSSSRPS